MHRFLSEAEYSLCVENINYSEICALDIALPSGGFSSLLKGWLHRWGVKGQQKLKNVCDLRTLKLAKAVKICE